MKFKYFFAQCVVVSFFSFCTNAAERNINIAALPLVKADTVSVREDTTLKSFQQFIIDTLVQYPTVDSLLAFRNRQGQKLWDYSQQYLRNNKGPAAQYIVDSILQYENEMFSVALYKHLLRLPKVITAFNMFRIVTYSNMIPDQDKMTLFKMYPAGMRQSALGESYLDMLTAKGKNVGTNIDAISNNRIIDRQGQSVPFAPLLNNDHTYTLLIVGASWCSPCLHQDIILEKLIRQGKVDTGKTRILFFSIDDKKPKWENYLANFRPDANVFLLTDGLNSPLLKEFAVPGIPYYLLLDKNRNVVLEGKHLKQVLPTIAEGVNVNSFF